MRSVPPSLKIPQNHPQTRRARTHARTDAAGAAVRRSVAAPAAPGAAGADGTMKAVDTETPAAASRRAAAPAVAQHTLRLIREGCWGGDMAVAVAADVFFWGGVRGVSK